jgi:AcrR family transcriptional regulator
MDAARRRALFEAMLTELAEKGYEGISTASALDESGVSVEEFAAEYGDADECLFAAYEELGDRTLELVRGECSPADRWPEQVGGGLARLLEKIAERPELARMATRGFPAIRPSAYRRYAELVSSFAPLISGGREYSGMGDELPADVELLAVGAAESLIFAEVDAGRAERLPSMLPEIHLCVLVPLLGPDLAGDEMRSAAARNWA